VRDEEGNVIDIILPEDEEGEGEGEEDVEMGGEGVEAKTDVVRCKSDLPHPPIHVIHPDISLRIGLTLSILLLTSLPVCYRGFIPVTTILHLICHSHI
jgi:hypothetical protein